MGDELIPELAAITNVIGDSINEGTLITNQDDAINIIDNINNTINNFDSSLNASIKNIGEEIYNNIYNDNSNNIISFKNTLTTTIRDKTDDIINNINNLKINDSSLNTIVTTKVNELLINNNNNNEIILENALNKIKTDVIIENIKNKLDDNMAIQDNSFDILIEQNTVNINNYINNIDLMSKLQSIEHQIDSSFNETYQDNAFIDLLNTLNVDERKQTNILDFIGNIILPTVSETVRFNRLTHEYEVSNCLVRTTPSPYDVSNMLPPVGGVDLHFSNIGI